MRSITMPDLTAAELFSKAVCMSVTIRKIGLTRKAKVKVKSKADQNMFHITKSLVTCEEYSRIQRLDSRIRRQLHCYDLPAKIGRGMAIVPASCLHHLSRMIEDFRNERASLIDAFVDVYPERKDDARVKLKEEFREEEYPTISEIRESFHFDVQFMTFDLPGVLSTIDEQMAEREREKMAEKFKIIGEECRNGLRELMQELVDHLLDKLTPDETGKPKALRSSAISNLMTFLDQFEGQNVSNDQDLEKLVAQLRTTLQGVTPKTIRTDDTFQSIVRTSLQSVKNQLDTMVITKPTRRILVSEETD
jgi:hypothetical protein